MCHTQRVYVRATQVGGHSTLVNGGAAYALARNPCGHCDKESHDNISSRAFSDSTGIYLGVYDSLQVSSEPAGAGTEGFLSISTRRIWAREYQGKEVYEVHGARFEIATWTQLTTQPINRQLSELRHGVIEEVEPRTTPTSVSGIDYFI